MKDWRFLLLSLLLLSCKQEHDALSGQWIVNSKYYSATYEIFKESDGFDGLVLYYNDGTTRYKHDGSQNYFIFRHLRSEGKKYVDGVSGATSKQGMSKRIEINQIDEDTLEVTSYIVDQSLKEIWTRIAGQNQN